jgi:putative hydrolase of the HAD superfamily
MLSGLLVDLDDTLLDYSGGIDVSWQEACTAVAVPSGVELGPLVAAIAEARQWFWSDPERQRRGRADMLGAWRSMAGIGLEGVGAPVTLAAAIAEDYAARRRASYRLFPGAVETLGELRRQGVPMALVTNGDRLHQRDKIERFDLARFFDAIVIEGEFGIGKPEEKVYRHALDALGVAPRSASMVGDNLEWDVAAPQRLGLRGVWVDGGGQGLPADSPVRPDHIIGAFRELVTLSP